MQKIYIIRHGKTDWNLKGLMQGHAGIPLNNDGMKEALNLSKNINLNEIDICLCSPLKRAVETAQIICSNKINIIIDNKLIERNIGDYEGTEVNYEIIKKHWDLLLNDTTGNIESIKDCLKRAKGFLGDIKIKYPNKTILIVSHGSFIKALHFNLIGYDLNTDFLSFYPKNTTLYEYIIN